MLNLTNHIRQFEPFLVQLTGYPCFKREGEEKIRFDFEIVQGSEFEEPGDRYKIESENIDLYEIKAC